jgi:hypothetical protein
MMCSFYILIHLTREDNEWTLNTMDHPRKRGDSLVGNHLATAKMDDKVRASDIVVITAAAVSASANRSLLNQLLKLDWHFECVCPWD